MRLETTSNSHSPCLQPPCATFGSEHCCRKDNEYSESCYSKFTCFERAIRDAFLQIRVNVLLRLSPHPPIVISAMSAAVDPTLAVVAVPEDVVVIDSVIVAHTTHLSMTFKSMHGTEVRFFPRSNGGYDGDREAMTEASLATHVAPTNTAFFNSTSTTLESEQIESMRNAKALAYYTAMTGAVVGLAADKVATHRASFFTA